MGRNSVEAEESRIERRIEELIAHGDTPNEEPDRQNPQPPAPGSRVWSERYQSLLRDRFPEGRWLEGTRLVADCANGAMSWLAPALLRSLGAEVCEIETNPSGTNINAGCGAVHPASLIDAVVQDEADLGVAFDGDGDRSLFVSANGRLIDGDAVLLLMARRMKTLGTLEPPTIIGTSMTNYSLEKTLGREGIRLVRVDVGDRHVFKEMRALGSVLGGEPSGHIIFSDFGLSGDGLLTTLRVCEAIVAVGSSLGGLTDDWKAAPQLLKNVPVERKIPLETMPAFGQKIDEISQSLDGHGRVVVRYSGTEALLRVMIESDSDKKNEQLADELISVYRSEIE